jgi:hypothetical protein
VGEDLEAGCTTGRRTAGGPKGDEIVCWVTDSRPLPIEPEVPARECGELELGTAPGLSGWRFAFEAGVEAIERLARPTSDSRSAGRALSGLWASSPCGVFTRVAVDEAYGDGDMSQVWPTGSASGQVSPALLRLRGPPREPRMDPGPAELLSSCTIMPEP